MLNLLIQKQILIEKQIKVIKKHGDKQEKQFIIKGENNVFNFLKFNRHQ